ncbi:hypothetical protein BGZ73_005390, partial [Actinomortierella ambigua]
MSHEYDPNLEAQPLPHPTTPPPFDPNLETPTPTILLHPTKLLEDNVSSYKNRHFFFNMAKADEPEQIPLKSFPKGSDINYTAPKLNVLSISDDAKKRDQDLASLAGRLAQATRPIDSAAYVLLRDHGPEDPQ